MDIGGFQGLTVQQRLAEGRGVTALSNAKATMLMLTFGPTRMWSFLGAASTQDVETAFPDWEMDTIEPADTAGLG